MIYLTTIEIFLDEFCPQNKTCYKKQKLNKILNFLLFYISKKLTLKHEK